MKTVHLPRPVVNRILGHAQSAPEREVCGLVAARNGRMRCIPVDNTASDPQRRFVMDPAAQIEAMRAMREAGEELFAIYHSHPRAPAEPSAADLEQSGYPQALHLIVSLNTEGVLELRGYRYADGGPEAVQLEILED